MERSFFCFASPAVIYLTSHEEVFISPGDKGGISTNKVETLPSLFLFGAPSYKALVSYKNSF